VSEHTQTLIEIRDSIRHFEQRMDARFDSHESRFDTIDRRFDIVDRRFEAVDRRFEGVDRRIDNLDDKISRQFIWLVGIQVTTLVAIVGALLARP
jgi:hypothetical protein